MLLPVHYVLKLTFHYVQNLPNYLSKEYWFQDDILMDP